ncbi:DNA polymerase II [Psychrosphaera sp. F3M07]|uniref:DNA polymerase II n=1 Tax=Psychrosphaera sp. F3M07 TaxID=2841560 RepID=UPI001C08C60F|nr:DNA polymerase II [Psychrosphaera sp. F3M07]MBU2917583.1 DNA polymerase II [Psychrosphaera sp. F3M07]
MTQEQLNGFLLTRKQFDLNGHCVFELWVTSETGSHQLIIENEKAVCFAYEAEQAAIITLCQQNQLNITNKPLDLKAFDDKKVFGLYANSLKDYHRLRKLAQECSIELLEADIKPIDRFLMERFIQGELCFTGVAHQKQLNASSQTINIVNQAKIKQGEYSPKLSTLSVDIECDENGYLYSIGCHGAGFHNETVEIVLYNGYQITKPDLLPEYTIWLESEWELLLKFNQIVAELDPDVIIGWNFVKFDIRVLVNAAKRNGIKLKLGRDGSELEFIDGNRDGEQRYPDKVYVAGRVILDGIEVMKNATYSFPSFSLNNVASEILGEEKLIQESGTDKLAEIKHLYKNDPSSLIKYNLQDCILVSKIFIKEKLIEFVITRTKLTGVELDRVGGSVAAFTNLYLPHAHRKGWVAPNLVAVKDYVNSPGGFVMDSIPGIHKDILVFDFKSLYPSIMRTFNVDPVALLEAKTIDKDQRIPGFRGGEFSRGNVILSTILDKLWQAREQAKSEQNKVLSNAIKIIMNSFYGVLGSSGCRFYDTKLASSITMRGHWVLHQSKLWFEQQGLTVIYGDTDSIFVSLDDSKFDFEHAERLGIELNNWFDQKLKDEFDLENKMELEFETHFSPFFMPTIRGSESGSKKRYAGMKQQLGKEPELIFKGMETVRSDWTELAKMFQTNLFKRVFAGLNCDEYISTILSQLKQGELDHLLIYRKRIRQKLESYVKTTPPHIKAARLANSQNKETLYTKGSSIEYIITVNGPQVIQSNIIPNYEHYIEKQIFPIAEAILANYSPNSLKIFNQQLILF